MARLLTSPAPLLTSPAPLLHLSWPLLHLSSLHLSRLEGSPEDTSNHFKTNAKRCKKLLYKAIRCGYVLGLHGTSPDLYCTSPDLSCAPPAPLLTPAAPLFAAPLQQKLEGFPKDTSSHFKTKAKLCKAFKKAIRCGYVLGLHGVCSSMPFVLGSCWQTPQSGIVCLTDF